MRFGYSLLSLVFACTSTSGPPASRDVGQDGSVDSREAGDTHSLSDMGSDGPMSDTTDTDGFPDGELQFLDRYPLMAAHPESDVYHATEHAFYVGSLGDGTVHRIDATTGLETVLFEESQEGPWWTLGMALDTERQRLWVCAMLDKREFSDQDPPYDGVVWVFDLETGERTRVHPLADAAETATCTDVALTRDGVAYFVDREHPNVYRVGYDSGATLFASDDLLAGGLVGLNAVVVLPDESALLAVVYLPSRMVRIDLLDGSVTRVELDGSFFDATPLSGADGLVLYDESAFVTFGSELVRVRPTLADWSTGVATEVTIPAGMTDSIVTPNGLYLVNGQAVRFALGGEPDPFVLVRFSGDL